MITDQVLNIIAQGFIALLGWLPDVTTLPTIGGYDIDTALVNGVSGAYTFANVVWPVYDVLVGAAFIWAFHMTMIFAKMILGSRVPSHADR